MKKLIALCLLLFAAQASLAAGTTISLQRVVNDVATSYTDMQKGTAGAAWTYPAYAQAGERNEDSTTGTDYQSVAPECAYSAEINLSTDASTTVYPGPAILCGYTLTVTIGTEAATIDDNTTAKMTLPVSWPIGDYPNIWGIFETSLVVNPGTNSTGTLQVRYRPLDASGDRGVTWP